MKSIKKHVAITPTRIKPLFHQSEKTQYYLQEISFKPLKNKENHLSIPLQKEVVRDPHVTSNKVIQFHKTVKKNKRKRVYNTIHKEVYNRIQNNCMTYT